MAPGLTQEIRQRQELRLTPQMQQSLNLLQLSRQELAETVRRELLENPFLEERSSPVLPEEERQRGRVEDRTRDGVSPDDAGDAAYDRDSAKNADWEDYLGEFASSSRDYQPRGERDESFSPVQTLAERTTLEGHLLWQLRLSGLDEKDLEIGGCVIGNLSSTGYLEATAEEIAAMTGAEKSRVERVLARVRHFDPVGVAARDVKECLLAQLEERGLDGDPVLTGIVSDHLKDIEERRFRPLMRRFGLDEEGLARYLALIRSLDPMPGAAFGSEDPVYVSPDVYVRRVGDDFVVLLNDDDLPHPVLDRDMEWLAERSARSSHHGSARSSDRAYFAEKERSARWLIRSLEQRDRTLRRVVESIVRHQRGFFERGPEALKPLVLREVADDIGVNESTVSRVTTGKYVATPHGIFELKYFFNSAVTMADGTQMGSGGVKDMLKKLVQEEDGRSPLSDEALARALNERLGVDISRRTVAKYRGMLGIPTSSKRKRLL